MLQKDLRFERSSFLKQPEGIGCRLSDVPTKEIAAEDGIIVKAIYCEEAPLDGHCMPESSFIDFKCFDGWTKEYGKKIIHNEHHGF